MNRDIKIAIFIIFCAIIIAGGYSLFTRFFNDTQTTEISKSNLESEIDLLSVADGVLTRYFVGGRTEELREDGVLVEIGMFFDDGTFFVQNIQEDIRRINEYRTAIQPGVLYFNSDMLYITVEANTPAQLVFELAYRYNAQISSYRKNRRGEWYSFTFNTGLSRGELQRKLTGFESLDFVIEVELSLYAPTQTQIIHNINNSQLSNDLWGLNSINAVGAWEFEESMEDIRVIVYDSGFYSNHEHLNFRFILSDFFDVSYGSPDHGTHVAGIIGAEFNSNNRMRGIASNSSMYAVPSGSFRGTPAKMDRLEWYVRNGGGRPVVINRSVAHNIFEFAASRGNLNAIELLNLFSREYEDGLLRLIEGGHEFLIAVASGNQHEQDYRRTGDRFIVCTNNCEVCFGYRPYENGNLAGINGMYGIFAIMENPEVRSRIITVGAIQMDDNNEYQLATFSQRSNLLDVNAPGVNIYSTLREPNYYGLMNGTSMSTPFVAGLASMIFGVNPNLTGTQVRQIIINTADNQNHYMINAGEAVRMAIGWGDNSTASEIETDINANLQNEAIEAYRVDLREFLNMDYGYMLQLLGEPDTIEVMPFKQPLAGVDWEIVDYTFSNGLAIRILTHNESKFIWGVSISYDITENNRYFHFEEIDNTSTYEDVLSLLGVPTSRFRDKGITFLGELDFIGLEFSFYFDRNTMYVTNIWLNLIV